MIILFCDNGFGSKEADYFYQEEYEAAKENKFNIGLVSFEELTKRQNVEKAISRLPQFEGLTLGIYRGWMLKPNDYENLYNALIIKIYS